MSGLFDIAQARADLYEHAGWPSDLAVRYSRAHGIDMDRIAGFCGCFAVVRILQFEGGFFDLAPDDHDEAVDAAVIEAFDKDGETTIDLVAWPLSQPQAVLSMFRKAPLLGLWEAMLPYTYTFGSPLILHRHPLDWLKSGCVGAAIATPQLAARVLLDLPGRFAPQDLQHAREVDRLIDALKKDRMVIPRQGRAA